MNNLNNYIDKTQYCLASMPQLLIGLPTKGLPVPFLVKGSIPGLVEVCALMEATNGLVNMSLSH